MRGVCLGALLVLVAVGIYALFMPRSETEPAPQLARDRPDALPELVGSGARPQTEATLRGIVVSGGTPVKGAWVGYAPNPRGAADLPNSVIPYLGSGGDRRSVRVESDLPQRLVLSRGGLRRAVRTDTGGRFALPFDAEHRFVYAVAARHLPARVEATTPDRELVIPLRPGWRVSGVVLPPPGERIAPDFRFALLGATSGFEVRVVRCDPKGRFEVVTEGTACVPFCLDPRWQFSASVREITPASGTVRLTLEHAGSVQVLAAETGGPLSRFHVCVSDRHGRTLRAGPITSTDGWFRLLDEVDGWPRLEDVGQVAVWAEGRRAWTTTGESFAATRHRVAKLERGGEHVLAGAVDRDGTPVTDARVSLRAASPHYNPGRPVADWTEIAASNTDAGGRFLLEAPQGDYVLVVRSGPLERHRRIVMPTAELVRVELGGRTRLIARLRGFRPGRQMPPWLVLRDGGGFVRQQRTTATGGAIFDAVAPGRHEIVALSAFEAHVAGEHVESAWQAIMVQDGGTQEVQVIGPRAHDRMPEGQRLLTITLEDVDDLTGWEARDKYDNDLGWSTLALGGTVMLKRVLEIRAPDGRHWTICPLETQFEAEVLTLRTRGAALRGTLVDEETGTPLAGHRVIARETGASPLVLVSTEVDATGTFRIEGLRAAPHHLTFEDASGEARWGLRFVPHRKPAENPTRLRIALPRIEDDVPVGYETAPVDGRVLVRGGPLEATSEHPMLFVDARFFRDDGTLGIQTRRTCASIGDGGAFRITVPIAPAYEIRIRLSTTQRGAKPHVQAVDSVEALRELRID